MNSSPFCPFCKSILDNKKNKSTGYYYTILACYKDHYSYFQEINLEEIYFYSYILQIDHSNKKTIIIFKDYNKAIYIDYNFNITELSKAQIQDKIDLLLTFQ